MAQAFTIFNGGAKALTDALLGPVRSMNPL
jgi:hypothetical protein